MNPDKKIAVLGFGNVLMKDDGLGPYVIKMLEVSYDFCDQVSVMDLGTPGLGIDQYLAGLDALIIVDVIRSKGQPGEVRTFRLPEILKHPPGLRMSPHDPGLNEALLSLQFQGVAPKEVLLVGVIPEDVEMGVGLTPAVRNAVPAVQAEILQELLRLGVAISVRSLPRAPDIWWETGTFT
jgi:hydrogenase maturation protease